MRNQSSASACDNHFTYDSGAQFDTPSGHHLTHHRHAVLHITGPRLVLNIGSPLVRSLGTPLPSHVRANVASTLRVLAILHSGAPLRSRDHVILANSVAALVKTATDATSRDA